LCAVNWLNYYSAYNFLQKSLKIFRMALGKAKSTTAKKGRIVYATEYTEVHIYYYDSFQCIAYTVTIAAFCSAAATSTTTNVATCDSLHKALLVR
jgi:ribonuclease HIII